MNLEIMGYKITALHPVTVFAYVTDQVPTRIGTKTLMKPVQRETWISLRQNEVRDDLGMVVGIHPNSLPSVQPVHVGGNAMILLRYKNRELPKEFNGLFRLEVSDDYPPDGGID